MSYHARRKCRRRGHKHGFRREGGRTPKHVLRALRDRLTEPEREVEWGAVELPVDEPLWGSRARYVAQQLRFHGPSH